MDPRKLTKKFNKHVQEVCSKYGITSLQYYHRMSPEFDVNQIDNHETELVVINGKDVPIDVKIVPLIARLNIIVDGLTTLSCQHDLWGWVSISFDAVKYKTFCDKVLEKAKQKYLDNYKVKLDPLVRRLCFNTMWGKNPGFSTDIDIYNGDFHYTFSVNLLFAQSQIKVFENELDNLFA